MTLKEHIDVICNNIKNGLFQNEASVSQGIVLRLLDALDWPKYDTQVIIPEYSVERQRVDFALCYPPSNPVVFIEVKQVGQSDGSERQLFEYAFHAGIPIAILTDGLKWQFFHPIGQGNYKKRRVYTLDLIETDSETSVYRLNRYLNYESVRNGEAAEAIAKDYQKAFKEELIEENLPDAWSKLVEEKDDYLLEVVAEKVEHMCGYKTTADQVENFLRSLKSSSSDESNSGRVKDSDDPNYILKYREMLKNPNSLPSKIKNYIDEKESLSWAELKKACVKHFGCKSETSGSIGASLRVLEKDGYVTTNGWGDGKRIFSCRL